MCFTELIGYTCGHTGATVLRPCPMTTEDTTFPVCSNPGRRPILAGEMCPACLRIMHGRANLVLEWEHHWMHERGVCGCPVVFPDLIAPRVAGKGQSIHQQEGQTGRNSQTKNNKGRNSQHGGKKQGGTTLPKPHGSLPSKPATINYTSKGESKIKKGMQAQQMSKVQGKNNKAGIAPVPVRIRSLFAAEWVDEHRQRHKAGFCECPGDFSFYQTPEAYGVNLCSFGDGSEQAVQSTGDNAQAAKGFYAEDGSWIPGFAPDPKFIEAHSIPIRSSGAIYELGNNKSANPLYNYIAREGEKMKHRFPDGQTVMYPEDPNAPLPLVGLPIGVTECPENFSHVGPFEECILRRGQDGHVWVEEVVDLYAADQEVEEEHTSHQATIAGLVDEAYDNRSTRLARLLRKSASVACMREKMFVPGRRFDWRLDDDIWSETANDLNGED